MRSQTQKFLEWINKKQHVITIWVCGIGDKSGRINVDLLGSPLIQINVLFGFDQLSCVRERATVERVSQLKV